jgi:hypothetical protein
MYIAFNNPLQIARFRVLHSSEGYRPYKHALLTYLRRGNGVGQEGFDVVACSTQDTPSQYAVSWFGTCVLVHVAYIHDY